jgi:hypothetical protein
MDAAMSTNSCRMKFIADKTFNDAVKAFAKDNPSLLKIESEHAEKDPTRLGFDLQTIAEIVTLIAESLTIAELAIKVIEWLKESKSNKVIVQTPFRTVEVHNTKDLTEGEVRKILKLSMEL